MGFKKAVRRTLNRGLLGTTRLKLTDKVPPVEEKLADLNEFGLYLHVPFCRQICPYCPYNKTLFEQDLAERYVRAVCREIDFYAPLMSGKPVTSFYIGGGTPTTLLNCGIERILEHIHESFDVRCDTHMESHPNDLSAENLRAIKSLGVRHLSVGIEALQDDYLRMLRRPYCVNDARRAVGRAAEAGFDCVNIDVIFALPGQTLAEVEFLARGVVDLQVDQVAAYPLFDFPYTAWQELAQQNGSRRPGAFAKRRMLSVIEDVLYAADYRRSSVWAFTRNGVPRYCSVTVPLYIGLGASAGTYLHDVFYLNTFNVPAYVEALEQGRLPIALSIELTPEMQMGGWLYWRLYETRFRKAEFEQRFGRSFEEVYGRSMRMLARAGFIVERNGEIACTDRGAFWLHWIEDFFSIDYVARLWGTSISDPWPTSVTLDS